MSELRIYSTEECPQGSPMWFEARAGIPTASEFSTVMAKGEGKTRSKYMRTLAGEILTGTCQEGYKNADMERGNAMEPEARALYSMIHDVELKQVGFMRRDDAGASPDSLIGDDGLLEVKTKIPHLQIECLLADRLPPEHVAQCQGQLLISGRQWLDFVSYWPGLPLFVTRVYPDVDYQARLIVELRQFNTELNALVERIRSLM